MFLYTTRRLFAAIPLMLGAATIVFAMMEAAPGQPIDMILGDRPVSPEIRERIERVYGFDGSPATRYARWMKGLVVEGDLGWSHSRSRPVASALLEAGPATLLLAGGALGLQLLAGIGFGLFTAWRRRGLLSGAVNLVTLLLYAMPTFWLGLMAVLLFSYGLGWLPASSMETAGAVHATPAALWLDRARHLALPAGVLGLGSAAIMIRFVRSGLLANLSMPFARAARARGASGLRVLVRHALPNAVLPVINLLGLSLPALLSGSLVVEVVFAWPGLGRLTYDAIRAHDVPVAMATTLLATALVAAGGLIADLAMSFADPRIRLRRGRA